MLSHLSSKKYQAPMILSLTFLSLFFSQFASAGDPIYITGASTGFFTPFNANTPAGTLYGDSGWVTAGGSPPVTGLDSITLQFATTSDIAVSMGTTDLLFTLNDGDPSGLVFGSGAELYNTTVTGVELPALNGTDPEFLSVTIPLPNLSLTGGFNNVGWSIGVENYLYGGSFGFQNRGNFNQLGFYTNNASEFTPNVGWSLFSFGPSDPADIANFVFTVTAIPEPSGAALMSSVAMVLGMMSRWRHRD